MLRSSLHKYAAVGAETWSELELLAFLSSGCLPAEADTYLQDTVISTLVAGMDGFSGSKSPIDAIFRKLLFMLSVLFLPVSPLLRSSPFFPLCLRGLKEDKEKLCASSARSGAKVPWRRRDGLGEVMSLLSLLCVCIPLFPSPSPFSFTALCCALPPSFFFLSATRYFNSFQFS